MVVLDNTVVQLGNAIRAGNAAETERLLAAGGTQYVKAWGGVWVNDAVYHHHADVLGTLLAHGACPNTPLLHNETPLHLAVTHKQPDLVRILLAHNVAVNAQDAWGCTPLWRAVEFYAGVLEITELLLAHGADPHIANREGITAYQHAQVCPGFPGVAVFGV